MAGKMRQIKSLLSSGGESLVCGEGQLQHALGMSARSRSPLPPTPSALLPPLPPHKPPRKNPPAPVKQYDKIELRSNAWKTLGVNTLTHTERPHSPTKVIQ